MFKENFSEVTPALPPPRKKLKGPPKAEQSLKAKPRNKKVPRMGGRAKGEKENRNIKSEKQISKILPPKKTKKDSPPKRFPKVRGKGK